MVKLNYPNLEHYSMDGYAYENLKDARETVERKKQSFIMINDGKTGLGKTTFSFQQAFFFARGNINKFNLKHVLYDPVSSFDLVANSKKGDVWVFDESILFNSRSAMSQYNKSMILLLSTIRSKQIYVIMNIPSFFDLDRAITMNLANVLFHLYGDYFGDRGKYLVFDDKKMKDLYIIGKKYYSYNSVKANFYATFNKTFLLDENDYENKKKLAINKMLEGKDMSDGYKRIMLQRNFLFSYLNQFYKMPYLKIEEIFPEELRLPKSTMSDAIQKIRERYDPEWLKKRKLQS